MTAIMPLAMTWLDFFTVWADKTLLAADSRRVDEFWAFWIAHIGKMWLISRGQVALSLSIKLRVAVATLCVLKRYV
jgi:hypothetical protein